MHLPSIILGVIISTLYGAAYHLWRGGGLGRMLYYMVLAWIGFWAGHFLGNQLGVTIGGIGPLQLGAATMGSAVLLGIGYWLGQVETAPK
jgi:hypothetical protein